MKLLTVMTALINKAYKMRVGIIVLFLFMFIPASIMELDKTDLSEKVSDYPSQAAVLLADDCGGIIQDDTSRETMGVSLRQFGTVFRMVERQREVRGIVVLLVAVVFFIQLLKGKASGVLDAVFSNRTTAQKYVIAYIDAQDGCKRISSFS